MLAPSNCELCPRRCHANRQAGEAGFCGAASEIVLARAALHYWEEPVISGNDGSGTIFFSGCPLCCIYCQNASIALAQYGKEVSTQRLVEIMFSLKDEAALNINFVTPTHYTPHIIEAVRLAKEQAFDLPIVWNTSGYELPEVIESLQNTVDVYLTDFKYAKKNSALAYSHAPSYPQIALEALEHMLKQIGLPQFDEYHEQLRMRKGVVVRHLLLPGHIEESKAALKLLFERFGNDILYSIMNQYTPVISKDSSEAQQHPNLLQHVSDSEYEEVLDYADALGIEDYFWQEGGADEESFIPPFDTTGV